MEKKIRNEFQLPVEVSLAMTGKTDIVITQSIGRDRPEQTRLELSGLSKHCRTRSDAAEYKIIGLEVEGIK